MKIDTPSLTPSLNATAASAHSNTQPAPSSDFANVWEQAQAPDNGSAKAPAPSSAAPQAPTPSATRTTRSGDTLIGIVRDEAKSRGISLSGSQEYKLAMTLASSNGIANPNQIATGKQLQLGQLSALLAAPSSYGSTSVAGSKPPSPTANVLQSTPAAQALQTNKAMATQKAQASKPASQHPVLAQTLDRAVARGFIPGNEKQDVYNKVLQVSSKHRFAPDDFARLTLMESDGMNPQASNQRCHGIIQFCDGPDRGAAGVGFGEKPKAILGLSVYQQLHLVDTYFDKVGLKKSGPIPLDELYLSVLQPAARTETRSEAPLGIPGKQASKLYEGSDNQAPMTRSSIVQGLMQNTMDRLGSNSNTSPRGRLQSQKTADYESLEPRRTWQR